MNITVATKDDLLAINQLYKKLHPIECKLENPIKHIDKANIEMHTLVAKSNSRVIGFLMMLIIEYWDFKFASVEELFVDKDFRKKGFGKRLVKKAIEIAKEQKVKVISIETDADNVIARTLYSSLGFKDDSEGSYKLEIDTNQFN